MIDDVTTSILWQNGEGKGSLYEYGIRGDTLGISIANGVLVLFHVGFEAQEARCLGR